MEFKIEETVGWKYVEVSYEVDTDCIHEQLSFSCLKEKFLRENSLQLTATKKKRNNVELEQFNNITSQRARMQY